MLSNFIFYVICRVYENLCIIYGNVQMGSNILLHRTNFWKCVISYGLRFQNCLFKYFVWKGKFPQWVFITFGKGFITIHDAWFSFLLNIPLPLITKILYFLIILFQRLFQSKIIIKEKYKIKAIFFFHKQNRIFNKTLKIFLTYKFKRFTYLFPRFMFFSINNNKISQKSRREFWNS